MIESNYWLRFLDFVIRSRFKQSVEDYRLFAKNKIGNSENVFRFGRAEEKIIYPHAGRLLGSTQHDLAFDDVLQASKSHAFIIIKDDKIIYEKYLNGYDSTSVFQTFSITKSFSSALVGIALSNKYLGNINDSVTKYLPELKANGFDKITINNLLQMHSGIRFKEGFSLQKEMVKSYLSSRSRELIDKMKIEDEIGKYFHYNDYHLILLAIILERVLNISITKYFEENIWKKIGTEFPAYMCLDNSKNGLEKIESGLVCTPIDLAKYGRLMLNRGKLNGVEIIPEEWISYSTDFNSSNHSQEYFAYYDKRSWGNWFRTGKAAYKNFWWGYKIDESCYDYFAMGILGQILYVSPHNNAIGIRIGNAWGIKGWWPTVIKEIIDSL
jgi:CubicO group peptidase (beta-lactamase class C family)